MARDSGVIRAQVEAVERVGQAVRSFADQIQQVIVAAHTQMKQKSVYARAEVQHRRQAVEGARRATAQAEMALARCRENCGGLMQAVATARSQQAKAEQSLARAQQASQMVEQASLALNSATRAVERTVSDHSHAAVGACLELSQRLRNYLNSSEFGANTIALAGVISAVATAGAGVAVLNSDIPLPVKAATIAANAENDLEDQWLSNQENMLEQERRKRAGN